jgi:hypothetical protein
VKTDGEIADAMDGRISRPRLPAELAEAELYAETETAPLRLGGLYAIRRGKLGTSRAAAELYDLSRDPSEVANPLEPKARRGARRPHRLQENGAVAEPGPDG